MRKRFDPSRIEQYFLGIDQDDFLFEGRLFVSDERAWLEIGDGAQLHIGDDGFVDRLLEAVPCYVGGHYLYNDLVIVDGSLTLDSGKLTVVGIVSVKLNREGEGEYCV